jgi:hypothetical protein
MIDWDRAYTIAVEECGAPDGDWERPAFLAHTSAQVGVAGNPPPIEYRFCGALGFGGKLRYDPFSQRLYVTCYREDETPARLAMIERANERLDALAAGEADPEPAAVEVRHG